MVPRDSGCVAASVPHNGELFQSRDRIARRGSGGVLAPPLLFTVLVLLLAACHGNNATPTEDITVWQLRGKWSGHELLQTEPFISTTGLLRVTWEAQSPSPNGTGTLRIVLHSDVSGRSLATVLEHQGPGGGVKYVTEDPRSFFLVIESRGLDWMVEVAEGVAATRTVR